VEDLKFELDLLNAALKKLDADWDFTVFINPLLADQGPAIAVVPKLKRQIDRMTKIRDEFLQKKTSNHRCSWYRFMPYESWIYSSRESFALEESSNLQRISI
jgi:hypothetical protein